MKRSHDDADELVSAMPMPSLHELFVQLNIAGETPVATLLRLRFVEIELQERITTHALVRAAHGRRLEPKMFAATYVSRVAFETVFEAIFNMKHNDSSSLIRPQSLEGEVAWSALYLEVSCACACTSLAVISEAAYILSVAMFERDVVPVMQTLLPNIDYRISADARRELIVPAARCLVRFDTEFVRRFVDKLFDPVVFSQHIFDELGSINGLVDVVRRAYASGFPYKRIVLHVLPVAELAETFCDRISTCSFNNAVNLDILLSRCDESFTAVDLLKSSFVTRSGINRWDVQTRIFVHIAQMAIQNDRLEWLAEIISNNCKPLEAHDVLRHILPLAPGCAYWLVRNSAFRNIVMTGYYRSASICVLRDVLPYVDENDLSFLWGIVEQIFLDIARKISADFYFFTSTDLLLKLCGICASFCRVVVFHPTFESLMVSCSVSAFWSLFEFLRQHSDDDVRHAALLFFDARVRHLCRVGGSALSLATLLCNMKERYNLLWNRHEQLVTDLLLGITGNGLIEDIVYFAIRLENCSANVDVVLPLMDIFLARVRAFWFDEQLDACGQAMSHTYFKELFERSLRSRCNILNDNEWLDSATQRFSGDSAFLQCLERAKSSPQRSRW